MKYRKIINSIGCLFLTAVLLAGCAGREGEESSPSSENAPPSVLSSSGAPSSPASSGEAGPSSEEPAPEVPDDPSIEGYFKNSIYIYGDIALEPFDSGIESAKDYAKAVSNAKTQLGSGVKVYNLVVPTHIEFALPKRYSDVAASQKENLDAIHKGYTSDVVPVDVYDILSHKRNEYIYLNTDHHWNGLGAYYAYTEFAKAAGFTPIDKASMTKKTIPGLLGSLYDETQVQAVKNNPDTVEYFQIPGEFSCMVYSKGSSSAQETTLLHEYAQGKYAYGVFLGGDKPLFVCKNQAPSVKGRKIAVVKESFGNAFSPFLAPHYEEVHIIDQRYFKQNLKQYVQQNGISEVLFINNIKAANAGIRIQEINNLFK